MKQKTILIKNIFHRNKNVILFLFEYDQELITFFKKENASYSASYKAWYIPFEQEKYNEIKKGLRNYTLKEKFRFRKNISTEILSKHKELISSFKIYLEAQNYSNASIRTYLGLVYSYCVYLKTQEISNVTFYKYLSHMRAKEYSASSMRQFTAAIKLLTKSQNIASIDITKVEYPRKKHPLPKVLSAIEIKRMLAQTINIKHKAIISTLYATGMRRGELLALKVKYINGNNNTIRIVNGKGGKDRIIPLSLALKRILRKYYSEYKPQNYLFEGTTGGAYTASSVNQILKKCALKAKIPIAVSAHVLRHSYATHLLENGTNLRYIQELLGHKSSRTTEVYTKVSNTSLQNIQNPLDQIFEVKEEDIPF